MPHAMDALPIIQALADPAITNDVRKNCEQEFEKARDENPRACIAGLVEICQKVAAAEVLVDADKPMVTSTLVLLKNTIPKVF